MRVRRSVIFFSVIWSALLSLAPALAAAEDGYEVSIDGAPRDLKEKLEIISQLKKGQRDYPTTAALRRAALRDTEAFGKALKAAGYYAGTAEAILTPGEDGAPDQVTFKIETGSAFKISDYEILYQDDREGRPASMGDAKLTGDKSAAGAALRDTQQHFLNFLWENGYPSAEIIARRAIANLDNQTAHAVFVFKSGPKASFGEAKITGLVKTKPSYLRKLIAWEEGEEYERSKLVSYRDRLAKTGLFSTIDVTPGAPDDEGAAPVLINLAERKRRTIGAGISFSTSEGPGGRIFFENRNIFGNAENFRIELTGSQFEQAINFDIVKPLPRLPGQAITNVKFSNETTDAFDARSFSVTGGLSKKWLDDNFQTTAAVTLETSNVKTNGVEERTFFVSAPISLGWNSEDDLLSPTKGVQASWTVTPYTGTDSFTQSEIIARSRVNFGAQDRFTLAARGALGATFGADLNGLPANKRFYAGGGGSVRGFGFQEAGPLDAEGNPIGGLSLIEGAIEARAKISQNIQIAAFADAGSVSSTNLPNFDGQFFVGYGGGVRYFTPIGPIRVDVAFPLNQRPTDRAYQIFIALGQPF